MTDRDGDSDRLQDRLSKRFDSDRQSTDATETNRAKGNKRAKQTKETPTDGSTDRERSEHKDAKSGDTVDHRDEWNTRLLYIPDDLSELLEYQYKRLDLEADWEVKKERHFYPVVVAHGVEQIAEMDTESFTDAVRDLGIEPT